MLTLVRLGETERAGQVLADLGEPGRGDGEICIATAALRLAQDDPHAAAAALAPVLDGSAPVPRWAWWAQAFLLEAIARDALGDPAAAGRALERALDLAEPDGTLGSFLLDPAPGLLERHARHRTAHASLLMEVRSLLAGRVPAPAAAGPQRLLEPLRDSELRVLRYLPSDLTVPEIAAELHVSTNTVKTHMRNLYAKLGTHRRHEAVERARTLGPARPLHTPALIPTPDVYLDRRSVVTAGSVDPLWIKIGRFRSCARSYSGEEVRVAHEHVVLHLAQVHPGRAVARAVLQLLERPLQQPVISSVPCDRAPLVDPGRAPLYGGSEYISTT